MIIASNKKAFYDYFIEEKYEAGLVLYGWEVKAIRSRKVQLKESYIRWDNGAFYLIGCHISPLKEASTHIKPDAIRKRKLLLNQYEINRLIGKIEVKGYALIPLDIHCNKIYIKISIGLAKGKKQFDKRQVDKEKNWKKDQQRLIKKYK